MSKSPADTLDAPDRQLALAYADKLWTLENAITAFALVQLVAVMFAIGTNEIFRWTVSCWEGALAVAGGSALRAFAYLLLLRWCHRRATICEGRRQRLPPRRRRELGDSQSLVMGAP